MLTDTSFQWIHTLTGGASTSYFTVPYICTVKNFRTTLQGTDPGDADTLTVTENSAATALGVATFGTGLSAGDSATWVANATTGKHVLAANEVIKVTGSIAVNQPATVLIDIELDPYARTT